MTAGPSNGTRGRRGGRGFPAGVRGRRTGRGRGGMAGGARAGQSRGGDGSGAAGPEPSGARSSPCRSQGHRQRVLDREPRAPGVAHLRAISPLLPTIFIFFSPTLPTPQRFMSPVRSAGLGCWTAGGVCSCPQIPCRGGRRGAARAQRGLGFPGWGRAEEPILSSERVRGLGSGCSLAGTPEIRDKGTALCAAGLR